MVIKAIDHKGFTVGIVNARSRELAEAYWQGQGLQYDLVMEIPIEIPEEHITGVIPILKTKLFRRLDIDPIVIVDK